MDKPLHTTDGESKPHLAISGCDYICKAAAIGSASEITSKGLWFWTAATVDGQESVIQKYLKAGLGSPLLESAVKRFHEWFGNTPWVTYALTDSAPCSTAMMALTSEMNRQMRIWTV